MISTSKLCTIDEDIEGAVSSFIRVMQTIGDGPVHLPRLLAIASAGEAVHPSLSLASPWIVEVSRCTSIWNRCEMT